MRSRSSTRASITAAAPRTSSAGWRAACSSAATTSWSRRSASRASAGTRRIGTGFRARARTGPPRPLQAPRARKRSAGSPAAPRDRRARRDRRAQLPGAAVGDGRGAAHARRARGLVLRGAEHALPLARDDAALHGGARGPRPPPVAARRGAAARAAARARRTERARSRSIASSIATPPRASTSRSATARSRRRAPRACTASRRCRASSACPSPRPRTARAARPTWPGSPPRSSTRTRTAFSRRCASPSTSTARATCACARWGCAAIAFARRIAELSLGDVVHGEGWLSDGDLNALIAGCRLLAYPPIEEPFGLVPLHAMAHARPVLAASLGGPAETVVDGVTGLLADPLDPRDDGRAPRRALGLSGALRRARRRGPRALPRALHVRALPRPVRGSSAREGLALPGAARSSPASQRCRS